MEMGLSENNLSIPRNYNFIVEHADEMNLT